MKRPIDVTRIGPLQRSLLNFDVLDFIYREGNYGWNCDVTLDDYRIEPCKEPTVRSCDGHEWVRLCRGAPFEYQFLKHADSISPRSSYYNASSRNLALGHYVT